MTMPTREDAWELLCEYTKGDSLRKHAVPVETAMRSCAERYGGSDADKDEWGMVGLLHDFDYDKVTRLGSGLRFFDSKRLQLRRAFSGPWNAHISDGRSSRQRSKFCIGAVIVEDT
jgi:hypothetical protein